MRAHFVGHGVQTGIENYSPAASDIGSGRFRISHSELSGRFSVAGAGFWLAGGEVRPLRSSTSALRLRHSVHMQVHPVRVLFANVHPFIIHIFNNICCMGAHGAHGAHAIAFLKRKEKKGGGYGYHHWLAKGACKWLKGNQCAPCAPCGNLLLLMGYLGAHRGVHITILLRSYVHLPPF